MRRDTAGDFSIGIFVLPIAGVFIWTASVLSTNEINETNVCISG